MTILAPLQLGMPPAGIGIYSRGVIPRPGPWDWYTGREWGFVGTAQMNAPNWQQHADAAADEAIASGRRGVILDREDRTPDAVVDAIAAWIRRRALRTRIVVTSYPSWNGLERLAAGARGMFSGSPQLYFDAATNARGWQRWVGALGLRIVPSIAAYVEGSDPSRAALDRALRGTPEAYAAYVASVPRAGGVIAWPTQSAVRPYMVDAIAQRWGGVNRLAVVPWIVGSSFDTIPGVIVFVVLALVLLSIVIGGAR